MDFNSTHSYGKNQSPARGLRPHDSPAHSLRFKNLVTKLLSDEAENLTSRSCFPPRQLFLDTHSVIRADALIFRRAQKKQVADSKQLRSLVLQIHSQ